MKLIKVDNFDRESVSDVLIAENVNPHYADEIVVFLNDRHSGDNSPDYFKLVEDGKKLYVYNP